MLKLSGVRLSGRRCIPGLNQMAAGAQKITPAHMPGVVFCNLQTSFALYRDPSTSEEAGDESHVVYILQEFCGKHRESDMAAASPFEPAPPHKPPEIR